MWSKCKNLSKHSSRTATVNWVSACSKLPHASVHPLSLLPGSQAASSLMLLRCHRRVDAVWGIIILGTLFPLWLCRALNPPVQMPAASGLDSCQLSPSEGMAAMWLYSKLWFHIPSVCICDPLNMTVQIMTGKGNFQRQDAAAKAEEDRKGWRGMAEKRWVDWVWNGGAENIRSGKG